MSRIKVYDTSTQQWIRANSLFTPNPFMPEIIVTAPTGSTVTCSDTAGTTLSASEVSGTWTLYPLHYGEWTIEVIRDTKSKTKTINIDAVKQYSIDVYVLPSEYTEVEYLKSSGTQYIDTGLSLNSNNYNISTIFSIDSYVSSSEQPILSIWNSSYNYWNFFISNSNNKFDLYNGSHNYLEVVKTLKDYNISLIYNDDTMTIKINDNTYTASVSNSNSETLKLFARGDAGSFSSMCLGSTEITVGNNLYRFIPCTRDSDTKPGMYDLVNDVFYTNAGTGEFIIPS